MDEDPCSINALPPFLAKTYEMVDDPSSDSIVSWSQNNKTFVVWNPPEFARDLLPKYFKHNNFSSFIRQLNTYGFKKVDPEQWEFSNDDFIRGEPHLMKNIHRRKPVYSHSVQNLHGHSPSLSDLERQRYRDDVEKLKRDKQSLQLELQRHVQDHQGLELHLQRVTELVRDAEKRQKSILSSFSQSLDNPELALSLVPQSGLPCRKRRLSGNNNLHKVDNQVSSSLIVTLHNLLDQLESSLIFWEDILQDVDQTGIEHNSAPESDESRSCADNPAVIYTQLNADIRDQACGIDMNSEPNASPLPEIAKNATTGVNDVFWEQFLTENPGSTNAPEVQQERKDLDAKKGKLWKSMKNVNINNLAEQLDHNTPAEIT